MKQGAAFRGQPLLLLGALLLGWLGVRVAIWQSPLFGRGGADGMGETGGAPQLVRASRPAGEIGQAVEAGLGIASDRRNGQAQGHSGWRKLPPVIPAISVPRPALPRPPAMPGPPLSPLQAPVTPRGAVGHNLLLLAGLAQSDLPEELVVALQQGPQPPPPAARPAPVSEPSGAIDAAPAPAGIAPTPRLARQSRWTADAWLLLRQDTDAPLSNGAQAYGRSQAGAVLRYRLAPASGHAPQAHLRGVAALDKAGNDPRESELALGISARPVPALPVRVAAEVRVSDGASGTQVRPAVYAVTELNPAALPMGARGELYLQGGYVGGDEFETAFVDGQARIDKPVVRLGEGELFAGAAAWGGAQKGAARVDIGPSIGASLGLGRMRTRVTADYRFRVAGHARPASGPALTIYAGF